MVGSVIQQIKERLDIVDVIGGYLKLEKTGINLRSLCPFHTDKKPSFFVSPSRQLFKCFGCGEHGSVIDFVMKVEGLEFGDVLKVLAKRAGIELQPVSKELQTKRTRLYQISEIACRFFEKQLHESGLGKQAKSYLLKRGLTEATLKKWRLGFSPDTVGGNWRTLSDFLIGRGYTKEEILNSGIAVLSEKNNSYYDRFRGRIMFPISDINSQVVGFGARIFEESPSTKASQQMSQPKYINTPATELYDKGRTLYGLNFGKMLLRTKDVCILTEGYMDVILSHQAEFENTVASSGTALTQYQLKIIKRYTNNLVLAYDMDAAGDSATLRGIDLAIAEGFNLKVVRMPQEKDPADVILENPKDWQEFVDRAQDIMEFYFEIFSAKFDKETPVGKKEIANLILPKIKQIPSAVERAVWLQKLANVLKVSESALIEEMKKIKNVAPVMAAAQPAPLENINQIKNRKTLLEEKILGLVLKKPECLELVNDEAILYFSPQVKAIFTNFKNNATADREQVEKILQAMARDNPEVGDMAQACAFWPELIDTNETEEIEICLTQLKGLNLKHRLQGIAFAIQEAEQKQDQILMQSLSEEFNQLAKMLSY